MPTNSRLFLFLSLSLLMGSCSTALKPEPHLLSKARSNTCQEALEKNIATLIQAQHLHLSHDVFSQKSTLYLTNQKKNILGQSLIVNDINGRKKSLLYRQEKHLFVATLNNKGEILNSKELKTCQLSHYKLPNE